MKLNRYETKAEKLNREQAATHKVIISYNSTEVYDIVRDNVFLNNYEECVYFIKTHRVKQEYQFDIVDLKTNRLCSFMA